MGRNVKPVDHSLKLEVTRHLSGSSWVSASYSAYLYAESLRKNKFYEEALDYYVLSVYLDLSGLNDSNSIDPIDKVFVGPRIMGNLHKVLNEAGNLSKSVEKAYQVALPFRYFEANELERIIQSGPTSCLSHIPHNEPDESLVLKSKYDDEDESQYDLPDDEWYEKYVQPELDKIDAQRKAIDAEILNELKELDK